MAVFPSLTIEGVTLPRVICGTNALLGWSHVSPGRDAWIREHFTAPRIARIFARCIELGVTAVMGPLFPRLIEALEETTKLTSVRMTWVSTTNMGLAPRGREEELAQARAAGDAEAVLAITMDSMAEQVAALKAAGAALCLFHGAWVDRWPIADGRLCNLARYTQMIRAAGMLPGAACHQAVRLDEIAHGGYDLALLATPVNQGGWHMRPSQEAALDVIARASKPVLAIKTLACGRYEEEHNVPAWLKWAAEAPGVEAIALGLMVEQEAEQSIPILKEAFKAKFG